MKDYGARLGRSGKTAEDYGIINQKGLNRKVRLAWSASCAEETNTIGR